VRIAHSLTAAFCFQIPKAKSDPQLRGVADAVVQRTGVDADDVPEVPGPQRRPGPTGADRGRREPVRPVPRLFLFALRPEPGDPYARQSKNRGEAHSASSARSQIS